MTAAACHDEPPKSAAKPRAATTCVLVGRPNAGKSSIFNAITGGHANVGNFPGITVDVLEGRVTLPSGATCAVVDLPGFYSFETVIEKGTDEGIARTFLENAAKQDAIIVQVLDGTRLALGLRLTKELLRAKLRVVVAITHRDILTAEGRQIDVARLSEALGIEVVLVASRETSAKSAILGAIEKGDHEGSADFDPAKLAASVVKETSDDVAKRRREFTSRVDRVLLHPVIGPFLFVGLMALIFAAVFLVADPAASACDKVLGLLKSAITGTFGKNLVTSFFADGILGGAGTVLAFMPQIVILTIAMELLEATGYLARGAFLVDRLLRLLGLSGRSFVPLLMGHACAIPAIQATRVVRDPKERLTTILVLPLMTCSARLPTYGLVIATFFSEKSALFKASLFVFLYFAGIFTALIASAVLRRTATKGKGLPLVLEMPAYRMPVGRVVGRKAWNTAKRFLRDVGTTIVAVAAILWVLVTVPMPGSKGEGIEASIAATVGHKMEPVTRPAGFDWRIDVGLIGSFGAREVMVGTMGVIFGVENAADDPAPLTTRLREKSGYGVRTGLALLAFFVLACQCMSTVAAIKRETRTWKWPAFVVGYTYVLAYVVAVLVYQVSGLFGIS